MKVTAISWLKKLRYGRRAAPAVGPALILLASGLATNASCIRGSCEDVPLASVDYKDTASWICRPGRDDSCTEPRTIHEVKLDGTVNTHDEGPVADRPIDCFYVYPTMDLRLVAGVHDDLSDLEDPISAVRTQAARFGEVCSVYAPAYRQVTLGTYLADADQRTPCFDVAFSDAKAAFRHYLDNDNKGRGFVLLGHSQGAQILSRLVREVIDDDPDLRARMIAALPIGWPLGTEVGKTTGGSFRNVPICTSKDELGCVIGYRSFAAGNEIPGLDADFREGTEGVCHNPASPDDPSASVRLADFTVRADSSFKERPSGVPDEKTSWARYADAFEARCVPGDGGSKALEVKWSPAAGDARKEPLDFTSITYSGKTGTHVLDTGFGQADLIADVANRSSLWLMNPGKP